MDDEPETEPWWPQEEEELKLYRRPKNMPKRPNKDGIIIAIVEDAFQQKPYATPDRCMVRLMHALQFYPQYIRTSIAQLKDSYNSKKLTIRDRETMSLPPPRLSHTTMATNYVTLLDATLFDPNICTFSTDAPDLVGDIPPPLYVCMVMLTNLTQRRFPGEFILGVIFAGISTSGKSMVSGPVSREFFNIVLNTGG